MKILIVNTYDIQGGAARAAYRLHRALLNYGVDSRMLVQNKTSDDHTIISSTTKKQKALAKVRSSLDPLPLRRYKSRSRTHFSPSWVPFSNIVNNINDIGADIVHLHWINEGMMRIEDLAKIKAPIVWSLHDMWPFTGGCHYNEGCNRYEKECGSCKVLVSKKEKDLSRTIYTRKHETFSRKKEITVVGLSNWLNECSKKSSLLKDKRHINLPNPINTDIFKPFDSDQSRALWKLPREKKLVLFGAMGATSDPRKGFRELSEALQEITNKDIELVVFGSSEPKQSQNLGFKTHYLGKIYDDVSLMTLYNAVDMIVVPSSQENLSNVIMESLACGTPVAAFDIGGNSDMIEHKKNGYLAKPSDTRDLAIGVEWILCDSEYDKLCENSRQKVLLEFSEKIVIGKYVKLYDSLFQ